MNEYIIHVLSELSFDCDFNERVMFVNTTQACYYTYIDLSITVNKRSHNENYVSRM